MIFSRTIIKIVDNSGAKYVKALAFLGDGVRYYAKLGENVLVVPKKIKRKTKHNKGAIKKRKKYLGLIVATRWNTRRRDGSFIWFQQSAAVLYDFKQKFLGTNIKSALCKELRLGNRAIAYKKLLQQTRTFL